MNKIFFKILLFASFCTSFVNGAETTILEQFRAEQVITIKNNLDNIKNRINDYILNTGDYTPTKTELTTTYSLPSNYFQNYSKDSTGINIAVDLNNVVIDLRNVLGSLNSTYIQQIYLNENTNERILSLSNRGDAKYPIDTEVLSFINLVKQVEGNADVEISQTAPSNTSKTWYKPTGFGTFDIYKHDGSSWDLKGSTGNSGKSEVQTQTEAELLTIPCVKNDKGYVVGGTEVMAYVCSESGWKRLLSAEEDVGLIVGEIANNIGDLLDRNETNKWFYASARSDIFVNSFLGNSRVNFIRKFNYWVTSTNINVPNYAGSGNLSRYVYLAEDISKLPSNEFNGTLAYLTKNNKGAGYEGNHSYAEVVYHNGEWINSVPTLEALVDKANKDFGKYWVLETRTLFNNQGYSIGAGSNDNTYWKDNQSTPLILTKGDRTDNIVALSQNAIYLTAIFGNDTSFTSSGMDSSYRYGAGYFKRWYFANGQGTNNLVDAPLITTNPYRTTHTLANSIGIAMFNTNLMRKVGNVWTYDSNGTNYNPCASPYNDGVDYSNLRCRDNYTYDSGWQYSYYVTLWENSTGAGKGAYWGGRTQCSGSTSCSAGGYTYYRGSFVSSVHGSETYHYYRIKRTQSRTRYQNFSSF